MTFNPRTGTFELDADDPRQTAMEEEARDYIAEEMQDPCTCSVVEGPHSHAPNAYPGIDPETGKEVWYGG